MKHEEPQYHMTNREKTMVGSKHKFWCMHCDGAKVGEVGKCPACGKRDNRKKRKMPKMLDNE